MKGYTTALGFVGAALFVAGGSAYLLDPESGFAGLVNLLLGALLVVAAGVLNPALFRLYGRWLHAFWGYHGLRNCDDGQLLGQPLCRAH